MSDRKSHAGRRHPRFDGYLPDHPRAVFAARQALSSRTAPHDHDIEHAPIVFIPTMANEKEWVTGPDADDSIITLAAIPGTAMPDDHTASEAASVIVPSAATTRHSQRTPHEPWQGRRWMCIAAGGVLGLMLVTAAGWGITEVRKPDTLPLKSVRIEGAFTHVTPEELQQAIAGATTGGFLQVDVDTLHQAALRVPWVESVNVRRVWPDTLHVHITERNAVARWADRGLLTRTGTVFSPAPASYPASLPELHGPTGTQVLVLGQYRRMSKAIAPLNLHIERLALDKRRAWNLTLDNGIELVLGRADSHAQLQRFVQVYPSLLATPAGTRIERVDMRYGNGLAVRWGKN